MEFDFIQLRGRFYRSFDSVDTKYGVVQIKVGYRNERCMSASPEIDDCIALADQSDVSVEKVYRAALAAWERGVVSESSTGLDSSDFMCDECRSRD